MMRAIHQTVLAGVLAFASGSLGLGCGDPAPRTQIMVTVEAETLVTSLARTVHVTVTSGEGGAPWAWTETFDQTYDADAWPIVLAIIPRDADATRGYEVHASALNAEGSTIVEARVRSGFAPGKTAWLRLVLRDSCAQAPDGTECQLMEVDPNTLMEWNGVAMIDGGIVRDAGGADGSMDDGGHDAGPADSGPPPECTTATMCDDGNPCTDDACDVTLGRCVSTPNSLACDDGDPCTTSDACVDSGCIGTAMMCAGDLLCIGGTCACPAGRMRCGSTCITGICCPGSGGGSCGQCGTRTCNAPGSGWDCTREHGNCPNPGSDVCIGGSAGCPCAPGTRQRCDESCNLSGCF